MSFSTVYACFSELRTPLLLGLFHDLVPPVLFVSDPLYDSCLYYRFNPRSVLVRIYIDVRGLFVFPGWAVECVCSAVCAYLRPESLYVIKSPQSSIFAI